MYRFKFNLFNYSIYLLVVVFIGNAQAELIDVTSNENKSSKVTVVRKDSSQNIESLEHAKENKRVVTVPHDKHKGKYHGDNVGQNGVKLEGVSKQDLEDLYYGTKMLENGY